jgi:uncharacterized protein YdeI (YjbR/CyaY-like superfamily)
MEITPILYAANRAEWRAWLTENHATSREIWLITSPPSSESPAVPYLAAVEEALCFGWIDSTTKRLDAERRAQRFSPRRPKSNWTELNKERARRLIAAGLMTDAGYAKLPDLTLQPLQIEADIQAALQADQQTWENFLRFPDLYKRIRIRFIEEQRHNATIFQQRLERFLKYTRQNRMFGSIT